jgi:hypothetical protein
MPSFKAGGREWLVTIDGPKIKRVREALGVDLGARDCKQFDQLTADSVLAGDVLCELLRKDIDAAGIGTDVFLGYLTGDEGEAAGNALIEAIIDFFPSRQRSLLREMLAKNQSVMMAADQVAREELNDPQTLEAMTARAVKAIREEFAKIRTP